MTTNKQTQLYIIDTHPDFLLKVMQFGAQSLFQQMRQADMIKPDKTGRKPNAIIPPHPAVLQLFKRQVELELDLTQVNN